MVPLGLIFTFDGIYKAMSPLFQDVVREGQINFAVLLFGKSLKELLDCPGPLAPLAGLEN